MKIKTPSTKALDAMSCFTFIQIPVDASKQETHSPSQALMQANNPRVDEFGKQYSVIVRQGRSESLGMCCTT
jgi:hypothetical protein